MAAANNEQKYFFTVVANDVSTTNGDLLPPVQFNFQTTADQAQGALFEKGYNLVSENGLFADNKSLFISEEFVTTKEGVPSYDDTTPDRLQVMFPTSPYLGTPYAGFPLETIRFEKLSIHRLIQPTQGGSRSRRVGGGHKSRRTNRRSSRSRRSNRK